MDVIRAVEKKDSTLVNQSIVSLIADADQIGLPKPFLADTKQSLDSENWDRFAKGLQNFEFLGEDGRFFLLAPYTTSRKAQKETVLSAIYGSRLELGEIPALQPILLDMFGALNEPIPHMVPILGHAGAGWFAGESGEAFLVPNGWAGLPDGDGPVLNNMSEQVTRVSVAFEAIRTVFDEASASLLLSVLYATVQFDEGAECRVFVP